MKCISIRIRLAAFVAAEVRIILILTALFTMCHGNNIQSSQILYCMFSNTSDLINPISWFYTGRCKVQNLNILTQNYQPCACAV
jgi:hypothetical protein